MHPAESPSPPIPSRYEQVQAELRAAPRRWLVTGCAGFIGSHLLEKLLQLDQTVIGLDNFSTGKRDNLEEVRGGVTPAQWSRFTLSEGDIRTLADCEKACTGVDFVLHQAALGSVPRSLEDPLRTHASNVDGTLNMLDAARRSRVARFVYASSSSVYGDHPALPKVEGNIGQPLSPYAASKLICEIHAQIYNRCYGLNTTGLRYFNVFGPRQDPEGAYAAVIPKWFAALLSGQVVQINGDGETSRDFCFVQNVVQSNLIAAAGKKNLEASLYNVACGDRTTLNELHSIIKALVARDMPSAANAQPKYYTARTGDVRHSLADVSAMWRDYGYVPYIKLRPGLEQTYLWYRSKTKKYRCE
jgi:UDP-N-acetylglucosamine 4-epimerase